MTFSICAYDPATGDYGVAVQSKFICVGPIVPWAEAGVGAVATQAFANTLYGPLGLKYLKDGLSAEETLARLLADDPNREHRQLGIVDSQGNAAAFTGKECFFWAGHIVGQHFCAQGNILKGQSTVETMAQGFEATQGDLADKLLAALEAVDGPEYGDARGQQSAALLVVRKGGGYGGFTDRLVDIRVDEHPTPIKELRRIFGIYEMTFLSREDPANLMQIEGPIAQNITAILQSLGYLPETLNPASGDWGEEQNKALENWFGINNFENKWDPGHKIWQSVYSYLLTEKGTPMVSLRKMSE